jgi:hypothetical protein
MTAAAILAAMLGMLAPHQPTSHELCTLRIVAAQIALRTPPELDPVLVAAVLHHESGFRADKRGKLGELGLGQLKRGTLATHGYDASPDRVLLAIPVNVGLTVRHMLHVRAVCGTSPAAAWLSVYSGRRHCRPSPYSLAVLADYKRGRMALDALEVATTP